MCAGWGLYGVALTYMFAGRDLDDAGAAIAPYVKTANPASRGSSSGSVRRVPGSATVTVQQVHDDKMAANKSIGFPLFWFRRYL